MQDPRLEVLPCMHSGTYADDCICERIQQHKCYIVATCDRDLRRRIRKAGLACLYASCIALNWLLRARLCKEQASS